MKSARFTLKVFVYATLINFFVLPVAQAQDRQTEPSKIVRKSGGVLSGDAINRPAPVYPPLAKAAKVSGSVVVEVAIDEEGNVISARALSGHPLLKDAAVSAAQQWTFKPTHLSGVPVKVIGTITFNFNMDYSKDIEALKEQIAANPNSVELHQRLGMLYSFNEQNEKAIETFKQALSLEPNNSSNHFNLARAYAKEGQLDEAIQSYKHGLSIKANSDGTEDVHIALGRIYFEQGRKTEAIEEYKQAVAINPYSQEAHLQLGMTYAVMGDNQSATEEYKILKKMNSPMADRLLRSINKDR